MSHNDNTVQAINLSTTHCRPFVEWNVCVCVCLFVNACLLPVNDMSATACKCLFVNVLFHVNSMPVPWSGGTAIQTQPLQALIFCFMNRKVSLHKKEKWPSGLLTASPINEPILCSLINSTMSLIFAVFWCDFKLYLGGVIQICPKKCRVWQL